MHLESCYVHVQIFLGAPADLSEYCTLSQSAGLGASQPSA